MCGAREKGRLADENKNARFPVKIILIHSFIINGGGALSVQLCYMRGVQSSTVKRISFDFQ